MMEYHKSSRAVNPENTSVYPWSCSLGHHLKLWTTGWEQRSTSESSSPRQTCSVTASQQSPPWSTWILSFLHCWTRSSDTGTPPPQATRLSTDPERTNTEHNNRNKCSVQFVFLSFIWFWGIPVWGWVCTKLCLCLCLRECLELH